MKLGKKEKFAYGLGAVGKDMVYMLSASYILYYYQDIIGLPASFVGLILIAAGVIAAYQETVSCILSGRI